ncbi:GNAT family N-acetyltransferase [Corynebacterium liangguodongii]|uniref:GNAT family N-acetyltransferase n=1 Tax=Corynebacterium liangguodongii TaxID=2079535 RepID=A0A2S0WEI2_9CORY|nr:GNAT family N-acetyltransferase [Corynebacterium liangguodongii]AWB84179.1 GNAT family N-acetyltransferase [Corynebacterium liangguodongii]PWC00190.1 GNAT family N-acetyltransferase [Corynebacterium liangguodongii]
MLSPLIAASDEAVAAYAFSATLAVQDITGLAASGVTASHVAKRLEGSAESSSYLFALAGRHAPRPLGPLGYPVLTQEDLYDVHAWVFVSLPLLEDTGVIEANVTLDAAIAPLPGEEAPREPWEGALSLIDALSNRLTRPIRHLWVTHAVGAPAPPAVELSGYSPAYVEAQGMFPVADLPAGTCDVVEGMAFSRDDTLSLQHILTSSSAHYPRGELTLDTVTWDAARLRDAHARLNDRGGTQLTALARDDDGRAVGLCEVVHYDSDAEEVCELGLVYVLPEHRRQGHGMDMLCSALAAAREKWPKVETCYCSYPAGDEAAETVARALGVDVVSGSTGWQRIPQ